MLEFWDAIDDCIACERSTIDDRRMSRNRASVRRRPKPMAEVDGRARFIETARAIAAGVAEWQTRWIQNPVSARTCGFESHLRYSLITRTYVDSTQVLFSWHCTQHTIGAPKWLCRYPAVAARHRFPSLVSGAVIRRPLACRNRAHCLPLTVKTSASSGICAEYFGL